MLLLLLLLVLLLLLLFTAADCWVAVFGQLPVVVVAVAAPVVVVPFARLAVGSHGETFYDDYCNSLPQTIITFHYENGGHIIT